MGSYLEMWKHDLTYVFPNNGICNHVPILWLLDRSQNAKVSMLNEETSGYFYKIMMAFNEFDTNLENNNSSSNLDCYFLLTNGEYEFIIEENTIKA